MKANCIIQQFRFCSFQNRRSLKVFLGGIAPESNEDDIRRAMSEYGTVNQSSICITIFAPKEFFSSAL